ncbi:hypothetical protein JCM4914_39730 [Streptomyces platensis subsp. malvinus]
MRGGIGVELDSGDTARHPLRFGERLPHGPDGKRNVHLMLHDTGAYPAGRDTCPRTHNFLRSGPGPGRRAYAAPARGTGQYW